MHRIADETEFLGDAEGPRDTITPAARTEPAPDRISDSMPRSKPGPLEVLTIPDVAVYLRLPVSTVYRLAQRGELPGQKVGRHWRFHRQTLEDWFRQGPERRREAFAPPDGSRGPARGADA
jgi:excisionase family DNA binding protein